MSVPTPVDVRLMNLAFALLSLVFLGLCALTAVRWASRLHVFDLQAITVTGDTQHSNVPTLRANVAPRISGTFLTVDLQQVRAAFEAVPWVRRAVVRREFPNRLRVHLQEHQPVALWSNERDTRLLNHYGEVFEANVGEVDQDSLPTLGGPEGSGAEVLGMYRTLSPLFEQLHLPLDQLTLSGRGSWSLRLEQGASVELGRGNATELLARTQRFLRTLTQVTARFGRGPNALESADLRHDNGYAIRLRGVTTQDAAAPKR